MGKYCCFFDPAKNYDERELTDKCPECGRTYGFVLEPENMPREIVNGSRKYAVIEPIGRGFYGATYLCEVQKRFKKERVLLKVTPVELYSFFEKDFENECQKHAEVAENTEHIVKIEDAFDTSVSFGNANMMCHVAELQYIKGEILSDYIDDPSHNQSRAFAQIAIDLLKLWHELKTKEEFHNDLHPGNLIVEQLDESVQRVDAIYDRIRLVAIDLNSVSDESLSNTIGDRIGDRKNIANHISLLSRKIRSKGGSIDEISDMDYRLIETLNKISSILSAPSGSVDAPEISELIEMIKDEFKSNISYAPWKKTFTLTKLIDGINAQTLPSCYVPKLLVDPENKWVEEVSISGPQLITGMRGCGKTMLLAALDVHARIANDSDTNNSTACLGKDRFVGIMASCRDLIDISPIDSIGITKLVVLYSIQIIRAVKHIRDSIPNNIAKDYHLVLAKNLEMIFGVHFDDKQVSSDTIFERYLSDLSNRIELFSQSYSLQVSCITAFELLADALTSAAEILHGKQVYYLLDDASTRYLQVDNISLLFTKILFMSQKCAFKVTTELQTLYSFKSPGNVEMAQDIRDYQIFDLGADVFRRTRDPKSGKRFIESIIFKRIGAYNGEFAKVDSLDSILGDCSLTDIAEHIISSSSSKSLKITYYGTTALTALCVGDIGDIILLFESIVSNNEQKALPVNPKTQTVCFQQLCSRRMYNLERRNGKLKEYVKAFSEASHKSLVDSGKMLQTGRGRIRQYNSLYIRMTSGDIDRQKENLRKLIDSGIFVFADGNGWPRAKSSDTDPMTQIKLAYRKLFGLSHFIGLANSDRYELSGAALEQWLETPTKEILLRNIGAPDETDDIYPTAREDKRGHERIEKRLTEIVGDGQQLSIFDMQNVDDDIASKTEERKAISVGIANRMQIVSHRKPLADVHFDYVFFGLGFEERCLESVKRAISKNYFNNIVLVQYDEVGYSNEIQNEIQKMIPNSKIEYVKYDNTEGMLSYIKKAESILFDVTGLYKPIIFTGIREALMLDKAVSIVYTSAESYYPLSSDIERIISDSEKISDAIRFVDLMRNLDTGDAGFYQNIKLMDNDDYDPVRPSALVGFVSPKTQRIFSVLDKTEYDAVHLLIPSQKTHRDILSRTAGDIAVTNYPSVKLKRFDTRSIKANYKELVSSYMELYIDKNFNFELSLTGSKMQAVAAAVFSSVCKVTQCWYVKPSTFDVNHFTDGIGETKWFSIKRNNT